MYGGAGGAARVRACARGDPRRSGKSRGKSARGRKMAVFGVHSSSESRSAPCTLPETPSRIPGRWTSGGAYMPHHTATPSPGASAPAFADRVTVLTRPDGKPAGKTIAMRDGMARKATAGHAGTYSAQTIELRGATPADLLDQYRKLVAGLTCAQSIILGHAPEAGSAPYRIVPAQHLDPGTPRPTGLRMIGGVPTCARLKENYTPSRLTLLDFDPCAAMPALWRDLDDAGRWDLFGDAVPEFAGAARLTIASGSGRVLLPSGAPGFAGPRGTHTYVLVDQPIDAADLDALRTRLEVRLWASALGFIAESKAGARLKRTLYDTAVMTAGREVFDASPHVLAPLTLAPFRADLIDGGCASLLPEVSEPEEQRFGERTGARIVRSKGTTGTRSTVTIEDHTLLGLGTRILTERGPMTVAAFLRCGAEKLRCQATFRASESWAGILRRVGSTAILHDVGTGTTYRIGADPQGVPSGLSECLAALGEQHPANAQGFARTVLLRQSWRCPLQMGCADLVSALAQAHPAVDAGDLSQIALWLEWTARKEARRAVTVACADLPQSVTVRHVDSISAVRQGIEAAGCGVHVVKAPHGAGKTQCLLRPIALAKSSVLAISPRVSLCADLSARLKLAHYQFAKPDEMDLAVCLNSIVNPKFGFAVDGARVVLVDEAARCIRECHSPSSTIGKRALETWRKLVDVVRAADLAVLVDADFNTGDVRMLGGTVTLWVVREARRDITAEFVREDAMLAEFAGAVAAGERCLMVADSARLVAGLAADLRGRNPGKNIVAIHQAAGIATAGTPEVRAILADIDVGVADVDVLLLSPSVESGVSINLSRFQRHFACYFGAVEPSAFNQMLLRDRTAKRWRIAINGHGFKCLPATMSETLNGLAAAQRRVVALADREDGACTIAPATAFDFDCCTVVSAANGARNRYGADLWYVLEHRGWTVMRAPGDGDPGAGRKISASAKAAVAAEKRTAILGAPDKPAEVIATIRESYAPSKRDSAIVARADVRAAHAKLRGAIDAGDVDAWQDGALDRQATLFADVTAPHGLSDRDRHDAMTGVNLAHRSFDGARGESVRALFAAFGFDPVTGEGELTAAGAVAAFDQLKDTDPGRVLVHFGIARFAIRPKQPIRWAGDALASLGLWLDVAGHRGSQGADGRVYRLGLGIKRSKVGAFVLPGWNLMAEIQARRAQSDSRAYKVFTGAAVTNRHTNHPARRAPEGCVDVDCYS